MINLGEVADLADVLRARGVTHAHFSQDGQILDISLGPRPEETKQLTEAEPAKGKPPAPFNAEELLFASSAG